MLPFTAILVASEAMVSSKQPRRLHMTPESNSVTSVTHIAMSFWHLKASMGLINGGKGQLGHIDLCASPQVKIKGR